MHSRTRSSLPSLLCLALLAGATSSRAAETDAERPLIAVLDFQANGAPAQLTAAISGVVAHELERFGAFRVMTPETLRSIVAVDRMKQMLGCTDATCTTNLDAALGIDYVVLGSVSRVEAGGGKAATFTLELTLINQRRASRQGSSLQRATSEAELLALASSAVTRTVTGLLAERSGQLVLVASEAGATVSVDDVVLGTTPLGGALKLPAGPHLVKVEKDGFVAFRREVRVPPHEAIEQPITLIPSPDFAERHASIHSKLRTGAWISTAVAVLGAGAVGFFSYRADQLYGSDSVPGTFSFHRSRLRAGIEVDEEGNHREETSRLKAEVASNQRFTQIGAGTAAIGAVSAVALFLIGDDPARYDRFKTLDSSVDGFLIPGGAAASLSFSF